MYCSHSRYSAKHHIARYRYRDQSVKDTVFTAAKKKSGDCSRTKNGENGGNFGTNAEYVAQVEGAGSMAEEMPIEEAGQMFCLFFAKISLQLVSRRARTEAENTIRQISDANFDADKLCWLVK